MLRKRIIANSFWSLLLIVFCLNAVVRADETAGQAVAKKHSEPACVANADYFVNEVWVKVGERTCLKCHKKGGDAQESEFLLIDPSLNRENADDALRHNLAAFGRMASVREDGASRMLLKVVGKLEHGGEDALAPDSSGFRILKEFVRQVRRQRGIASLPSSGLTQVDTARFFASCLMLDDRKLLRRLTLSLAGRLPNEAEKNQLAKSGRDALGPILDQVMREDAFHERLQEAFNDILLTRGYDGVAEGALSYEHFKTRLWYQDLNPNKGRDKEDRLKYSHPKMIAHTKLVREYREGMRREPLELVTYIVRNERPFTEIVTADYILVSPYTARGYGIFEELKDKFTDVENPFEFIPTKIAALESRNGRQAQESETGFYPHAGLLSSFQYLKRYPTTETNRNRLRVRMYFQHFLGIDLLRLAPRVNDAAAITAEYKVPTMEASDCVVCHKIMDPIAGLFQDYYVVDGKGIFGPRKDGWYEDMFPPGLEGEALEPNQRWRSLQWLGERTAQDPRFATAMVEHVWYVLTGRKTLSPPDDIDDPLFAAKRKAYQVQRHEIEQIARRFAQANFNLKLVFKELAVSPLYRTDGLAAAVNDPARLAELNDVGLVRMLTPEQLERKLYAVFGKKWGRLTNPESKFKILYGGIDSKAVTERMPDPSGAMGAIQRILANDLACQHVAADFSLPAAQRRLFPLIEPDVVPSIADDAPETEADQQIRRQIIYLHELFLGRFDTAQDAEVQRTYDLFSGIVADAKSREGIEPRESYSCQTLKDKSPRDPDPHYTIRAWRAVVTYLLRQQEFLYE